MAKKTEVLNLRNLPKRVENGVYIGRGTKWGNPFVIGKDGTRDEVIQKYRVALWKNKKLLAEVGELKGKKLLCFCAPEACHGHVLVKALAWLEKQADEKACEEIGRKAGLEPVKMVLAREADGVAREPLAF